MSLTPAPLVWAAPGEVPPELVCFVSHFYPPEGLEVEWELRGGPEDSFQKAKGQSWLSALRHHSDGSVSLSAHLQPPPATAAQHGARYACRVHHPSLPVLGRSAEVTLEVAGNSQSDQEGGGVLGKIWGSLLLPFPPGLSGPSLEDGIGLFLSAFLLLGLFKALGWAGKCELTLEVISCLLPETSHPSLCPPYHSPSHPFSISPQLPACLLLRSQRRR